MYKMSEYAFIAGLLSNGLALVAYLIYGVAAVRVSRARAAMAGAGGPGTMATVEMGRGAATAGTYGTLLAWLTFAFLTASLVFRTIATGHGPFANMYEFSVAFAWGILITYLYFERKYHQKILGIVALPVSLAMLLYATTIPSTLDPLVPALQNNLLLSVHVAVAIVAYGTFTVAFGAAVLHLIQPDEGRRGLPKPEILDEIGYKAVVVGFPFLTLTIVLGAVWADVAWGRYWGWDPKETASLVTWLIYGAYLHARVVRGWRGRKAAWLLVLGFGATLHSYSGLNQD
jgi:ABC-type transport system involved in cytochrome c biogenesis permease subunit